jgi:hypothetical protein
MQVLHLGLTIETGSSLGEIPHANIKRIPAARTDGDPTVAQISGGTSAAADVPP